MAACCIHTRKACRVGRLNVIRAIRDLPQEAPRAFAEAIIDVVADSDWALQFPQFDALRGEARFQRVIDESRPPGVK